MVPQMKFVTSIILNIIFAAMLVDSLIELKQAIEDTKYLADEKVQLEVQAKNLNNDYKKALKENDHLKAEQNKLKGQIESASTDMSRLRNMLAFHMRACR